MSACRAQPEPEWPAGWVIPPPAIVQSGSFDSAFIGWPLGSLAAKLAEEHFEEIIPNWIAG